MQVGIVFLVAAVALYSLENLMSVKALLFSLVSGAAAVGAMIGVSYAFRTAINRVGSFHADVFIVGVSLLPIA